MGLNKMLDEKPDITPLEQAIHRLEEAEVLSVNWRV